MKIVKKTRHPPFTVVVVHGGLGGAGELACVAKKLSKTYGVLEPFQTKTTIRGQQTELKGIIKANADVPVT